MATDAGAIKYTVEAETGDLLNAEKVVDKSTGKMTQDFKKVDDATRKTEKQFKQSANGIAAASVKMTKSAKGVKTGLAGMGRGAGQVGVQIQQLVGQIQGGQNAAQAFAAQSADIGIVMGAPLLGVLAAFGFAIGGPLMASLGIGTSAIKELDKATEALKETVEETDDGVLVFTDSISKLAEKSEAAARIELAVGLTKTQAAIKAAKEEIDEASESWESWLALSETSTAAINGLASLEKVAKQMGVSQVEALTRLGNTYEGTILGIGDLNDASEDLSEKLGLTTAQALKFFKAVAAFRKDKSVDSMKDLSSVMADLSVNIDKPNKKLIELASRISKAALSASDAADAQKLFTDALKDFDAEEISDKTKTFTGALDGLLSSLESQIIALRDGEEAAFRYAAAQSLGLKSGEQFTAEVDQKISDIFRLKAAQDDAKEQEKGVKLSEGVIAKGMTADQRFEETLTKLEFLRDTDITNRDIHEKAITELERKHAEERQKIKDGLAGKVSGVGRTDVQSVTDKLKADLELLRQAEEQKIAIVGTYEDRRIELRRAAEEKIAGINKKGADDAILNFEALENQAIGTFAGIATGAMDGKDAVRSLAQSILTQMVGALIKMGIQAAIGQTTVAATGVATAATLSAAYATPAALVSLATSGANAPLAAAGISSTVALSQGLSIAGGRQFGGPTTQGNNYRINETGDPEIYTSDGKDYLTNSGNGKVTPLKEFEGGGGVTVNINNMAAGVDVQATPSDDGKTIEIAVRRAVAEMTNQVATGNGSFIRALKSGTNVTTKAGR